MIGLDAIGALFVMLAIALMSVAPLHLTITRAKVRTAQVVAMIDDGDADTPPQPERRSAIEEADAVLADDPLIRVTGELADLFNHV
jgi:hypothetical protein